LVRRGHLFLSFLIYESSLLQIEQGSARPLIKTFDVKKRRYFGNTSMEAEISLLMANQTLVRAVFVLHGISPHRVLIHHHFNLITPSHLPCRAAPVRQASPGKLIYDPFVGTGSMAYVRIRPPTASHPLPSNLINRIIWHQQTTAHFGALVFGSDIDGRQMRGKGRQTTPALIQASANTPVTFFSDAQPGIMCAATQYGVAPRILDLCTFDITRNPWRCGGLFDAIITDPPCK
jgi:tRNA (guanine10-N2)-methyltransferase